MVIDKRGFRCGIAIVLLNEGNRVFWAHRFQKKGWQFPQGGLQLGETSTEAMYRELHEETGLSSTHVNILAVSRDWLKYRLPKHLIRSSNPLCIGQRQKWFLLQLKDSSLSHICFDATDTPEFDRYRWVSYWYPLKYVIDFKREIYRKALEEFSPVVFNIQGK